MAAGQGFKTFNTGDVLTASDTNGYLMQGVWVFANAAARTAAVTSPQEGNVSYLKDTDSLEIYSGAAWVGYGSGDITGVTAGTGISGGGASGTVTITNSMATAINAKGDIIAGTADDAFDRLAIGTNGQVLSADSTTTTGLKWTSLSAAGGYTLLSTTSCSGVTTTVSSISGSYKHLLIIVKDYTWATGASSVQLDINGSNGQKNYQVNIYGTTSFAGSVSGYPNGYIRPTYDTTATNTGGFNMALRIYRYAESDAFKMWDFSSTYVDSGQSSAQRANFGGGAFNSTSAITSIGLTNNQSYSASAGTIYVYGVS